MALRDRAPESDFNGYFSDTETKLDDGNTAISRISLIFGIEGWLRMHSPAPKDWAAAADGWRRLGADMVMLYPMYRISNFDGHIENLRRFKEVASG
jgi:hypothetical protein